MSNRYIVPDPTNLHGNLINITGATTAVTRLRITSILTGIDGTAESQLGSLDFYTNDNGNEGVQARILGFADTNGRMGLKFITGSPASDTERMRISYDGLVTLKVNLAFAQAATISTTADALTLAPATAVVFNSVNAGVTANTNSTQGDNPITKMITQISVCANGGDAVTLPTAVAGAIIIVLNDGAEAADVFPASGDNINEAGANTAYSLAVNKNAMFIAHDTTHWSVILTA